MMGCCNFNITFEEEEDFTAKFCNVVKVPTGDYNDLTNKPSIEKHVLAGDSTLEQIGVGTLSVQDIEKILYVG